MRCEEEKSVKREEIALRGEEQQAVNKKRRMHAK